MAKSYIMLIDGDNVNCSYFRSFKRHIEEKYGSISEIYLFGKLKSTYLDDWKSEVALNNIYTYDVPENSKNNSDIQMILVAFQKYYSDEHVRNFIILSSDSDMLSVVNGLPGDAEVLVGYSRRKASAKYLAELNTRRITHIDIDSIRGDLSEDEVKAIVNSVLMSYLRYKLGNKFFSYKAIQEWLIDRYPGLESVTSDDVQRLCDNVTLEFTPNGVRIK